MILAVSQRVWRIPSASPRFLHVRAYSSSALRRSSASPVSLAASKAVLAAATLRLLGDFARRNSALLTSLVTSALSRIVRQPDRRSDSRTGIALDALDRSRRALARSSCIWWQSFSSCWYDRSRSEERRVGKECRSQRGGYEYKK